MTFLSQPPLLSPISGSERETISNRVYRILREAIVRMELKPGDRISEAEISNALGISRQPVREAFIKLSDLNLVAVLPQRGTFVVRISKREVSNAQFVRLAIEVAVTRRACERATEADIVAIAKTLEGQREAAAKHDHARFMALDEAFHRAIARSAECAFAWRSIDAVKAHMDRVRFLILPLAARMQPVIRRHQEIYHAIAARSADDAEQAMRAHLGDFDMLLSTLEDRHPELFSDDSAQV
jgi:DNA-binding GntR family transcriptional regulator